MADVKNFLVCVDGTHDWFFENMDPKRYDREFRHGHVRRISDASKFGPLATLYVRGPTTLGMQVASIFRACLDRIIDFATGSPNSLIALHFCGYSRGGAIALDLANELAHQAPVTAQERARLNGAFDLSVAAKFQDARKVLRGRSLVKTLILFDAVDMDIEIDGGPISASIGKVAHVRRSKLWGSRYGWGNVGTDLAEGSPDRGAYLRHVHCTHAAMGGLPGTGDIPKPLARALVKLPSPPMDWVEVELMFRLGFNSPTSQDNQPGLFVNPLNGVMVDNAGKAVLDKQRKFAELAKQFPQSNAVAQARAFAEKQALEKKQLLKAGFTMTPPKTLLTSKGWGGGTLQTLLTAYGDDDGAGRGLAHGQLNKKIGGLKALGIHMMHQKAAAELVSTYRQADKWGSHKALTLVQEIMGADFPAAL